MQFVSIAVKNIQKHASMSLIVVNHCALNSGFHCKLINLRAAISEMLAPDS